MSSIKNKSRTIIFCSVIWIIFNFPLTVSAATLDFKGIPMGTSEAEVRMKLTGLGISEEIKGYATFIKCYDNPEKKYTATTSGDRYCEYYYSRIDYHDDPTGKRNIITFAEVRVKSIFFSFYSDKLQRILVLMPQDHFVTNIIAALTAKYSKPSKVTTEKLQNRFGAVFDDFTWLWRFENNAIKAHLHASSDLSSVEYLTAHAEKDSMEQEKRKGRDKAKDL